MPTISLRLTEEEHAALKEWAHGSRRSMQREAVYRLFARAYTYEREEAALSELGPDLGESASRAGRVDKALDADMRANLPRSESPAPSYFPEREVKPDFKGKK